MGSNAQQASCKETSNEVQNGIAGIFATPVTSGTEALSVGNGGRLGETKRGKRKVAAVVTGWRGEEI